MFYYEYICLLCKKPCKAYEDSPLYKKLKINPRSNHVCQPCEDLIRLEAVKSAFG